jgi:hypothetical protein
MLKKITLNDQEVSVPIPIFSFEEAISWIDSTLLKNGEVITKIFLNSEEISLEKIDSLNKSKLSKDETLLVRTDSPKSLSIQILEVLSEMSLGVETKSQKIAIHIWKNPDVKQIKNLKNLLDDVSLMISLVDHINGILDYSHQDMAGINGCSLLIKNVYHKIKNFSKLKNWTECSTLIVGRLDPLLRNFVLECDNAKLRVLEALPFNEALPKPNFFSI